MNRTVTNPARAFTLVALGLAIAAMGISVANVDDAPGAALFGLLMLAAGLVLGVRAARNRLPAPAARIALTAGVALAAFAAFLTHGVVVAAALFPKSEAVPSAIGPVPLGEYADAVSRARELVRAAMTERNLPGVSVAVGAGGRLVWAEGFGWRDVESRTPVTPRTRFHIGTAAAVVAPAAASLALTQTGPDAAGEWSPEHTGEPEEDFPLFTLVRHVVFQPLGLAPAERPLPGDRASFYVPRADDNPRRGRRPMAMRDLACCANGQAFSSTPSDLVRLALSTNTGRIDGALAGGDVMSLRTTGDGGIVVAVTSNIAHADTPALAQRIVDAFSAR